MNFFIELLFYVILLFLEMIIVYYTTILIHESGHLIFGICSGYKFLYLRIGAIAFVKTEKGYHFKYQKAAGSAGQCLLYPTGKSRHPKYMLSGGIIFNFVSVLTFLVIRNISDNFYLLSAILFLCMVNILSAILNLLSFGINIESDGKSLKEIRTEEDIHYYNAQLMIAKQLVNGISYGKMEQGLFEIKEEKAIYSGLAFEIYFYGYYRLLEFGELEAAAKRINYLRVNEERLNSWLRIEIYKEERFLNMASNDTKAPLLRTYGNNLGKIHTPHDIRLSMNEGDGIKQLRLFKNYVYPGEVRSVEIIFGRLFGGSKCEFIR